MDPLLKKSETKKSNNKKVKNERKKESIWEHPIFQQRALFGFGFAEIQAGGCFRVSKQNWMYN